MTRTIVSVLLGLVFCIVSLSEVLAADQPTPSRYVDYDKGRKEAIVFVHGVTGDAVETWTNQETKAYWPALLRRDKRFENANVWVFSFSSPKIAAAQNIEELAIKLGDELRSEGVLKAHDRVYIICHSLGGLIVREALARILPPAEKVPLVYFFGTPSAGAELAGVAAAISSNPQFANMRPFTRESDVASFARKWLSTAENSAARYPQKIWSFCAYEIEGLVAGKIIVGSLSASYLCSTAPRGALANHVTMVKPANEQAEPYRYFASAYEFARGEVGQILSKSAAITSSDQGSWTLDVNLLQARSELLDRRYFEVDCDQRRTGEIPISATLSPQQRVVAAQAVIDSTSNLQNGSFDAFVDSSGVPKLRFDISGLPRQFFNCPGGGNAHVTVKYVVEGK
jgi:hypothetical protein